jgi:hypothetical protein
MECTRTITLAKTTWQQLDVLLAQAPSSDFIRYCLLDAIIQAGIACWKEKGCAPRQIQRD